MTPTKESLKPGNLIPNWRVKDLAGEIHSLWDYRQKTHIVLLYDPESDSKTTDRWLSAIQADQNQWNWLNVKFLIAREAPPEAVPGVYAIDRYGILLATYAIGKWNFDELEREFLYYEAKHC
jgi:hypothetical protein